MNFELFHVNSLFSECIVLLTLFEDVPKDSGEMSCRMSAYSSRSNCANIFNVGCNLIICSEFISSLGHCILTNRTRELPSYSRDGVSLEE